MLFFYNKLISSESMLQCSRKAMNRSCKETNLNFITNLFPLSPCSNAPEGQCIVHVRKQNEKFDRVMIYFGVSNEDFVRPR